ncbi:hypothetical protein JKY72_05865 [Candidatus Gracilibacteria bacterium]|nr:hypothetical protein [Candidatus Gracilibacteria bacterium]
MSEDNILPEDMERMEQEMLAMKKLEGVLGEHKSRDGEKEDLANLDVALEDL